MLRLRNTLMLVEDIKIASDNAHDNPHDNAHDNCYSQNKFAHI